MSDTAAATETDSAEPTPPEWLSLDPGEEIVWVGRPAFETLYGQIVTGLLLTVVLIGIVILLGVPFAYLRIQNTDYVVTTDSLYVKSGVFSTNIETVDLDRIQNTEYNRSFWGKQFDYGSISISTAGSSGAEISFDGIPDAPAVRDRITELQRRRADRGDDGAAGERDTPASAEQLAELVEEVRATREAFERIERHLVDDEGSTTPRATGGAGDTVEPRSTGSRTEAGDNESSDEPGGVGTDR
jgi:uncharacterized membrane protein YdbT with pleckstrin-like domain